MFFDLGFVQKNRALPSSYMFCKIYMFTCYKRSKLSSEKIPKTRSLKIPKTETVSIYMLFAGWEVRIVKNCDRGLENAARGRRPRAAFSRPRLQFFTIRTDLSR